MDLSVKITQYNGCSYDIIIYRIALERLYYAISRKDPFKHRLCNDTFRNIDTTLIRHIDINQRKKACRPREEECGINI